MSAAGLSNLYAVYRQSDPATSVEHAEYCNFLSSVEKQLVVTGANHVRVFRLNPYVLSKKQHERKEDFQWVQGTKLECMMSISLLAPVCSMAVGRLPGMVRDCLFLAFQEAKLSVVAYDPPNHDLTTISLHCYEEEIIRGGFTRDFPDPIVRCDPDNRCAAMTIYGRHLAIVPFLSKGTDTLLDDLDTPQARPKSWMNEKETPQFTLFSYSVPLESLEEKLQNVADMCFLQGYYEPTLLFLYEPSQTTSGRVAVRQDTYCILAVSLNVKDRAHAVIWTVNLLPFDCFSCLPVPKPIGGALVFGANCIIYLNQSVPAYGIAVNSCMRDATGFPLKSQEEKLISLDCSVADFISPTTILVCTRFGELYFLTLLVDNTNVVKGMQLEKTMESDIPTVGRFCDEGFFFMGSRLGDSKLLRYWEANSFAVSVTSEPRARPRSEGAIEDDLALYGEIVAVQTVENIRVIQYGIEVCDSLVNIGPCKTVTMGVPVSIPEPLQNKQLDPVVDIAFAGGHSKNGCVTVFQRQVRPKILTSPSIPGAIQLWTVGKRKTVEDGLEGEEEFVPGAQEFLLVTKELLTMVLELKGEIAELESSGFVMDKRTVAAGDLGSGTYIVQICPMQVVLLKSLNRVQEIELEISFPIARASIVDPYVILLAENGEIFYLHLIKGYGGRDELQFLQPRIHQESPATAVSVYRDMSGLFQLSAGGGRPVEKVENPGAQETNKGGDSLATTIQQTSAEAFSSALTTDDEDELLYGLSSVKAGSFDRKPIISAGAIKKEPAKTPKEILFEGMVPKSSLSDPNDVIPTYWVAVARENGLLEIFQLPDFKLVYIVKKFPHICKTLQDTDVYHIPMEMDRADEHYPTVKEILLVGLGANSARPHLFVVVGDELAVYEIFHFDEGFENHLTVRFRKLNQPGILRNRRIMSTIRKRHLGGEALGEGFASKECQLDGFLNVLYPFDDVNEYCGVFVAGPYPYWCFMTGAGQLRFHAMSYDGPINSFAQFHNINCKHGFIYMNSDTDMRICQLPENVDYDCSCPMQKTYFGRTVHSVVYLLDSHTYAVASSEQVPCKKLVTMVGDEKQSEMIDKSDDPNFIYPPFGEFKIHLYSPETMEPVPGAGHLEMEEFEHITVMKEVNLKSEGTMTGYQNYLAVGTIHNYGDEVLVRGRVFIAEVIEVVPDPDQPLSKHKMKTLYCKEQKGPVTSLCSSQGYLLTGMGQKVYIWAFKDNDLVGISFLDLQFYIFQMASVRNLTLVADVYKSLSLLRYQEAHKALSLASRDFSTNTCAMDHSQREQTVTFYIMPADATVLASGSELHCMFVFRASPFQARPMGIDFMIDNKQLAMLMSDENGNLSILSYQPEAKESLGGQRLLLRGDMHIGARITGFLRIQSHVSDGVVENKVQARDRQLNIFGTLDGALGFLLPLPEKVYRRLHTLQTALSYHLPHVAGLNPKSARLVSGLKGGSGTANRNFIDGDVLWQYFTLSFTEKQDFARRIATSREQLLDDLLELHRVSTHF